MRVLAIETSCDDTSFAIVEDKDNMIICKEMVAFHQVELHSEYGGVVPELASREHLEQFVPVLYELCHRVTGTYELDVLMQDIDLIAVTHEPWLPWSLLIWRTWALVLANRFDIPCQYVNHLDGHLFSYFLDRKKLEFNQAVVLSVSGWHTNVSLLRSDTSRHVYADKEGRVVWHYFVENIATTRDDAVGEAFDKISRMLWGPYPWWLRISQKASRYDNNTVQKKYPFAIHQFKRTLLDDSYDFSFSGMKSQAHNFIRHYKKELNLSDDELLPEDLIYYLSYQFQEAVADILIWRVLQIIADNVVIDTVALVGGVSANLRLREKLQETLDRQDRKLSFYIPTSFEYCTDNAAMIGAAALVVGGV